MKFTSSFTSSLYHLSIFKIALFWYALNIITGYYVVPLEREVSNDVFIYIMWPTLRIDIEFLHVATWFITIFLVYEAHKPLWMVYNWGDANGLQAFAAFLIPTVHTKITRVLCKYIRTHPYLMACASKSLCGGRRLVFCTSFPSCDLRWPLLRL